MKKISIVTLVLLLAMISCKKTPEVNLKYVDIERDLVTVDTTTANIQCDYDYITTLKKAYLYYGEGEDETNMTSAEMRVVQKTLYVELTGLKSNTTYGYYYEFVNGFNSMRSSLKTFKTESGSGGGEEPPTPPEINLPTVITATVTAITTNSAQCGGEVTNDGGAEVSERGICWSTSVNPTLNDSHVADGNGTGTFSTNMNGLSANTTYHVRAYAINEAGTAYGLDREFVTVGGGMGCDCDYVDLGLPSGTLWATCNVGANSPEECGDYFAWGETETKSVFSWANYRYCCGSESRLTKYCGFLYEGFYEYTDNLTILEPIDDAATVNWGGGWRMPTKEEWMELLSFTSHEWDTINGVAGVLFTAANGNSVFLGDQWRLWSSSLCVGTCVGTSDFVYCCHVPGDADVVVEDRCSGLNIRPVRTHPQVELPTVLTEMVNEITANTAQCSGALTNDGGSAVTECGFCWSTRAYPTLSDSHVNADLGVGSFSATISGLCANTKYLVRAYAINEAGIVYGVEKEFITLSSGVSGNHDYVDLGLPSGTLWATCNLGAAHPEDYGCYYAWGETEPKDIYSWSTYDSFAFDDAATVNWGYGWRMPTEDDCWELLENTTYFITTINGVFGVQYTADNGNSLFLPFAGLMRDDNCLEAQYYASYWSSTFGYYDTAVGFGNNGVNGSGSCNYVSSYWCSDGRSIRPVRSSL